MLALELKATLCNFEVVYRDRFKALSVAILTVRYLKMPTEKLPTYFIGHGENSDRLPQRLRAHFSLQVALGYYSEKVQNQSEGTFVTLVKKSKLCNQRLLLSRADTFRAVMTQ